MLIAILASFLLGFGDGGANGPLTPEALREAITASVDDPVRRESALAVVDDIDAAQAGWRTERSALHQRVRSVHQRRDASRSELDAALAELDAARTGARDRIVDLRFELRGHLTRDEWTAMFPVT